MPATSPEKLLLLAKAASNRYLKEKVPLNDTIQKLASQEGLNVHQVARIAEMANVETHKALWGTEPDKIKVGGFEVADPAKIAAAPAAAAASGDFMGPPEGGSTRGPSMAELFATGGDGHQGLYGPNDRQRTVVIIEKNAAARRVVTDDMVLLTMRHESEEKSLGYLVKQAYLGHGIKLEDIYAVAVQNDLGDVAKEYLPKIAEELHKGTARAELTKIAWAAPEDLIDREVPVTVVNGAQPIMISLDALKQYRNQLQEFNWHLTRIDDENTVASQRLRNLQG
jgi:hypothetical protein